MSGDDEVAALLNFYAYWAQRGLLPRVLDALPPNEREFLKAIFERG